MGAYEFSPMGVIPNQKHRWPSIAAWHVRSAVAVTGICDARPR
ncbi:hypothetical protein ROTO_36490 [Roseovarius tolerans]|uniref:Uncharacterized protein n=1 Tax=Roseovarius tolerans TaxID=74031 RepID=A0A0L6CPW7_9RHOB|nr:hypothetical protein ROTO_36490 [Roseovarius tolerans]